MDWTLKRVNFPNDLVVLGSNERSYTCGRQVGHKIFCPSLVVSRKHCMIFRTEEGLSIIDLKSSNGVFVNGTLLEPNVLVKLHENDVIGIGSSQPYRDNEPMFLYKLHKGNLSTRNSNCKLEDQLTQKVKEHDDVEINVESDPNNKKSPLKEDGKSTLKRNLSVQGDTDRNSTALPLKIPKLANGHQQISSDNDANAHKNELSIVNKEPISADNESPPEIQEIWSRCGPFKLLSEIEETSVPPTVEPSGDFSDRSNRLTLNLGRKNNKDESRKAKLNNRDTTYLENVAIKEEPQEDNYNHILFEPNKPEGATVFSGKKPDLISQKIVTNGTSENSRKTNQMSPDLAQPSTSTTSSVSKMHQDQEENEIWQEIKSDNNIRCKMGGNKIATNVIKDVSNNPNIILPDKLKRMTAGKSPKSNRMANNDQYNENTALDESLTTKQSMFRPAQVQNTNSSSKSNDNVRCQTSTKKFVPNILKEVSNKPDTNLPDKFKKTTADKSLLELNGTTNEIQPDENTYFDKTPIATSSPFKVKPIKQEPMTSFTVFDTVYLSDDDEDIFPSSQLFNYTANISVKVENDPIEIKDEYVFEDNEDIFNDDDADKESKDIIVLSDDDDDDDDENPWLHRLSESQRIKEEKPNIAELQSPPMEFVDDLDEIKQDPFDVETKTAISILESETAPPETKSTSSPKVAKLVRSMTELEIEKDLNKGELALDNDDLDAQRSPTFDPSSISAERRKSDIKEHDKSMAMKQSTPKGPKIIEPLCLPQRKRLSTNRKLSLESDDDNNSTLPSTNKDNVGLRACSVRVPKVPSNLTAKLKQDPYQQDKMKQKKYEEEQRLRRLKNKWTQGIPLPIGKKKSLQISKKEKLEIFNERKEKLKALAAKQNASSVRPSTKRVATKPKTKITTKNRGDFLIQEQQQEASSSKVTQQSTNTHSISKTKVKTMKSKSKKSDKTNKSISPEKTAIGERPLKTNGAKPECSNKNKLSVTKLQKSAEKTVKNVEKTSNSLSISANIEMVGSLEKMSLNQKENQIPNLLDEKENKKKKKKVSFSINLVTVHEYEIEPNNTLKKCTGKDALIPKEKLAPIRKIVNTDKQPKLEEFLLYIFTWNPSWLEEQKFLKTEPPIVNNDYLLPLLTNYKTYEAYYQIMSTLLLLELWYGITKEFETIQNNSRRQPVFCAIVNNSITSEKIPGTNTALTGMMLEVLASNEDIKKQVHPVYGSLIFLELCYRDDKQKQKFLKVFAYIKHVRRTPITSNTFFNRDLVNYVSKPTFVLTFTILTRPLMLNFVMNRVLRLRCVTYLRSNMRMAQALQFLPNSPLQNSIIDPKIEQYQLSQPLKQHQSSLFTKDKLNPKQLEAVFKVTETVVKKEPKVCLIQGPPGTGKSQVIVNMVMQILYGDNRYGHRENSLRILLCAPSNAALDELVLRLLDRRAKLTDKNDKRFKMVRVGLLDSMHPRVREISIEELAKREVKRTIAAFKTPGQYLSSVEEEKRFLEAKINALEAELSSSQRKKESQAQNIKMKLSQMKANYDRLRNYTQSVENKISHQEILRLRRNIESKLLIHADIIACTLSSCYTNIMETSFSHPTRISVCIVDEATQSCEAETLIPLMLGVNTLILVGDPAQLPATIISQKAKNLGLDQSLFSRLQRAFEDKQNNPVIMLNIQYRMDKHISSWPNNFFYGGKLQNALQNGNRSELLFYPYSIFNIDSIQSSDKFSNTNEAQFVYNLVYGMIKHMDLKKVSNIVSIGVITPYRIQQAKLNERFIPIINNFKGKINLEVNTVDSFQGRECDIIIMSCVRTNGIGFLSDPQRLCVALTRAKQCLVLCGNFTTFQRNEMWNALLRDAQSRKTYISIKADASQNEIMSHLVR